MIANPQFAPDRYELAITGIEALLNEMDLGRYALFHEVGEGKMLPDGSESMSGGVVTEHGKVFTFWTDWDAAHNRPVFTTWDEIEPEPALARSQEYRDARAKVGLFPLPDEVIGVSATTPDGVTHMRSKNWLTETPEGVMLLIFLLVLGAGSSIKFIQRKS